MEGAPASVSGHAGNATVTPCEGAQAGLKALYTCTSWYAYAAMFHEIIDMIQMCYHTITAPVGLVLSTRRGGMPSRLKEDASWYPRVYVRVRVLGRESSIRG